MKSLLLLVLFLLAELTRPSPDVGASGNDLAILGLAPLYQYPPPSWYGGAAMLSAARLAVEHVNCHPDVLPGLNLSLLEGDSGCNLVQKTLLNFTAQVFHHRPERLRRRIVGIVGPSCSESAVSMAPIITRPQLNLVQVAIFTTPDVNLTTSPDKYRNSFRTIGSSLVTVDALGAMLKKAGWNRIGALYEAERQFHTSNFNAFLNTVGSDVDVVSYRLLEIDFANFVNFFEQECVRVVFVFASEVLARKTICLALKNGLVAPNVQFLFFERLRQDFTETEVDATTSCNAEEMDQAMKDVILFNKRNGTDSNNTISGISYHDYLLAYEQKYNEYLTQMNITRSQVSSSAVNFFSGYYDAVWALALAVNKTASEFNMNEYRLGHSNDISDAIRGNLEQVSFEGMSGLITFNTETRDVRTIGVVITQGNVMQNFIENMTVSNDFYLYDDSYEQEIQEINIALGSSVLIVALMMGLLLFLLQVMFCRYSNVKEVKATSPILNHFIFSGCYLLLLVLVIFAVKETFSSALASMPVVYGVACSTMYWSLALGYSLIFATVSSKTWRIYRIFSHFRQGRVRFVSDEHLMLFITCTVLVDVILLVAWNLRDPWRLQTDFVGKSNSTLFQYHMCQCDNFVPWVSALFVYKGAQTVLAVYLSILVRSVKKKAFRSTKKVIVLIYALIVIFFVGFTLYGVFLNIVLVVSFLALSLTFVISVTLIAISLFLSNIWPVLTGSEAQSSGLDSSTNNTQKQSRKFNVPIVYVDNKHVSQLSLAKSPTSISNLIIS